MALSQTQVSQLYVAILNRASEGEGNQFWQTFSATDSVAEVANAMLATPDAQAYFGNSLDTDQAFIEHIYSNTFNKTIAEDPSGIQFWIDELGGGSTRGEVVEQIIFAATQPENAGPAQEQFNNRVDVSNYTADNLQNPPSDLSTLAFDGDLTVTDDDATVAIAQGQVDVLAASDDSNGPVMDGETFVLTSAQDDVDGTADNDMFFAFPAQNATGSGVIANTLATGDQMDGGAGTDTLNAGILSDASYNGATAVRPFTDSIENVFVNAIAEDAPDMGVVAKVDNSDNFAEVESLVRLNADNMNDLEQIWSNGSEASLRVENAANAGDTEDLAIGMRSTGNSGSLGDRDESNYEVYFEEDELTAGQTGEGSYVYDILNQESYDVNTDQPVLDFPLESVRFDLSFDGAAAEEFRLSIADGELDGVATHAQLVSLLNTKLDALQNDDARLDGLSFEVEGTFTDTDGRKSDSIQLVDSDPQGRDIVNGTIRLDEEANSGNLFFNTSPADTVIQDLPVTASVILDDVGRGSDGGFLSVGSMSEGSTSSTGIEVYDLTVQRDSSLSGLYTTNHFQDSGSEDDYLLDEVLISSGAGHDGDLTIGNAQTGSTATPDDAEGGVMHYGIELIRTDGFNGNLSLGTSDDRVFTLETLNTTSMGAEQSTTFWGDVFGSTASDDMVPLTYNTGAGDDSLNIELDGDAVDALGESLSVNAGNGDNNVYIDVEDGVSQQTMAELDNLSITTGTGEDTITVENYGRFDIDSGAGSDFIWINSLDSQSDENGQAFNLSVGNATGAQTFSPRAMYQANLTVTFAGFESTVEIDTDAAGNFIATQVEINEAIVAAINESPELSRLLETELSTGNQQLDIESVVDGLNDLSIAIDQPNVVDSSPSTGDVLLGSADVDALRQGLIDTAVITDSDGAQSPADVANAVVDGNIQGDGTQGATLYQAFNAGSSADATGSANFSVINAGSGDNDLVVMDSSDQSANILEVTQSFGKVSVVNFHDIAPNDVTTADTNANVGNHALDFTSYLDNETDASGNLSGNQQSATPIAVTQNIVPGDEAFSDSTTGNNTALANSVNFLRFDGTVANSIAWDDLGGADLLGILNGTTSDVVGGITDPDLDAVNTTTDLVGTTQDHIALVENQNNVGEYKVFYLTSEDGNTGEFASSELLGTLDFGASINVNLVGSADWDDTLRNLQISADGGAITYTIAEAVTAEANNNLLTPYTLSDIATFYLGSAIADLPDANTQGIIDGAQNAGDYVYSVADTLSNILTENNGGSEALVNAQTITIAGQGTALDGEEISLVGVTTGTAGGAIDFVDSAAALTQAELVTIQNDGNVTDIIDDALITVTGVTTNGTDFDEAAAIDLLDANDTIEFAGGTATLDAGNYNDVFGAAGAGVSATGGDSITITMTNVAVAGSAADDTFDYATPDTGSITDFNAGGTDTIDLIDVNAAGTITQGPTFAMADNAVFFLGGQTAGAADSDGAAATALSAAFTDDVDMTGSYAVIADDNSSAIYQVTNTGTDADSIAAGDLTLVGTVDLNIDVLSIDVA